LAQYCASAGSSGEFLPMTGKAHDLNQDTLTRCRRVLGEDHPDTRASARNLAGDLRALGEHQRAHDLNEWIRSQDPS